MKGNEQNAKYENRERKYGKPDWEERGKPRKRERRRYTEEATVRQNREEKERKKQRAE